MKKYYGQYGGQFVPELLMPALQELETAFAAFSRSRSCQAELQSLLRDFVGRPTPLYFASRLTARFGGARIFLKREDLAHTGAHKINNAVGQALLAKFMGKTRVVAETGAGQHGVAAAAAAARLGLTCDVYMGTVDILRQQPNVQRIKMLGANVIPVTAGSRTLKDAVNEALRDWIRNITSTHYLLGSALGPHPYPAIVRTFQSVIGKETKRQILGRTNKLPDYVVACVGGGSNAIGVFSEFIRHAGVRLVGVEAGGLGIRSGKHAARFAGGRVGIFHGMKSYLLQNAAGQIRPTHSISAGLDYAGVGPEHAHLHETGRVTYTSVTDRQALEAFRLMCKLEGIIPALESSHAVAHALRLAKTLPSRKIIVVNLSGRGDKDLSNDIYD